jgi:hypothetical protein
MPQVRYNGRLVFSNVVGTVNRYSTASSDAYKLYGLGKHLTGFDITEGGSLQNIVGFHYSYAMLASGSVELHITSESGEALAEADASPAASDSHQSGRKRSDVEGGRDQSARGDGKKGRRIGRGNSGHGAEARADDDLQPGPCHAPFFDPYAPGAHPFHAGMPPEGYVPHPFPSSYLGFPYPEQPAALPAPGGPGGALPPFHAPYYAPPHPAFPPLPGYWPGFAPPHPHQLPPHLQHQPPGFWQPQGPQQDAPHGQQQQKVDELQAPPSPSSHEAAAVLQQLWLHPPPPAAAAAAAVAKPRKQGGGGAGAGGGGGGAKRPGGAARPASSRAQTTITMGSSFVKRYFQKILSPDGVTPVSFDVLQNGVLVASGVQVRGAGGRRGPAGRCAAGRRPSPTPPHTSQLLRLHSERRAPPHRPPPPPPPPPPAPAPPCRAPSGSTAAAARASTATTCTG